MPNFFTFDTDYGTVRYDSQSNAPDPNVLDQEERTGESSVQTTVYILSKLVNPEMARKVVTELKDYTKIKKANRAIKEQQQNNINFTNEDLDIIINSLK